MAEGAPGPTSQAGAAVPPATHHLPHHTLAFELFGEGVDPSRALVECALHGTYQDARRLLKLGADVTAEFYHPTTRETETALGNAVWRGHWQLVKLLLEEGADPDQFDSLTCGPLIEAVRSDDTRTATLLLKGGADPNLEINAEGKCSW